MRKSFNFLFVAIGVLLVVGCQFFWKAEAATCQYHPSAYQGLELPRLTQELEGSGLIGEIHGAAAESQLFVMSVRDPKSFFIHQEFSLIPGTEAARKTLAQVNRHDLVCIQGKFLANPSPQKHIAVKNITLQQAWDGLKDYPAYQHEAGLPAELETQTSFVGKVHAVGAEGKILVMEYKDGVLPIYVASPQLTKDLYRGDILRLHYQIQKRPLQPTHLKLDPKAAQPIQVLDAIATWHKQEKTLSGKLVKFPQSPQIKFDVYAIEVETQGIKRTFTLVNFENPEVFQGIRTKLAEIWDQHAQTVITGRNMLINPQVTLEAKGTINLVSTEQANPQILLDSPDAIRQVEVRRLS